MLESLLLPLQPDSEALLRSISQHVTDDMLEEIAQADYGQNAERHYEALLPIRDESRFVSPMQWFPCEVLELTRNSVPQGLSGNPSIAEVRGGWMAAFASAALLRARQPPWNYGADAAQPGYNLIQLIFSLRALPVDFTVETSQFLAWVMLNPGSENDDVEMLYFALGVLWFALHRPRPPADERLVELCEWVVLREAELHAALPGGFDWWLLGVNGAYPPPSPWQGFGRMLCGLELSAHSAQLKDWVPLIGSQLVG